MLPELLALTTETIPDIMHECHLNHRKNVSMKAIRFPILIMLGKTRQHKHYEQALLSHNAQSSFVLTLSISMNSSCMPTLLNMEVAVGGRGQKLYSGVSATFIAKGVQNQVHSHSVSINKLWQ